MAKARRYFTTHRVSGGTQEIYLGTFPSLTAAERYAKSHYANLPWELKSVRAESESEARRESLRILGERVGRFSLSLALLFGLYFILVRNWWERVREHRLHELLDFHLALEAAVVLLISYVVIRFSWKLALNRL